MADNQTEGRARRHHWLVGIGKAAGERAANEADAVIATMAERMFGAGATLPQACAEMDDAITVAIAKLEELRRELRDAS